MDAEAAMATLKAEQVICRYADGVAEQIDHELTGDLYAEELFIEFEAPALNIKDTVLSHLSTT